jgi:drug/metabolite transporter (DMT)-like permease
MSVGIVYILLLLAVTASSVWHVLGKVALSHGMDASVFLVYRLTLSAIVLLAGGRFVLRIPFVAPDPKLQGRLVIIGVATFLHSVFFLYGLQLTTPFMCAVMQPAVPVLVWLMSVISGSEKSNLRKAIGVILCSFGAVGAASLSTHHAESVSAKEGTNFKIGIGLLVLQCFFYAIHLVFQQPLLQAMPPVQVTGMVYGIAGITMLSATVLQTWFVHAFLPLVAPEKVHQFHSPLWSLSEDKTAWLALGFCVLFASAFTHGIYSWATKKVAATTVSVFITVEPLTTTVVSLIITRSGLPSVGEMICAGILAVGVMLVLLGRPAHNEYEMIPKSVEEFDLETEPGNNSEPRRLRGSEDGIIVHRM